MLSELGKLAARPDQIGLTRPIERDCDILHNATGLGSEHKNAIGKIDRLVHVMRDEESRLWLESQNFRDITLQFLAGNRPDQSSTGRDLRGLIWNPRELPIRKQYCRARFSRETD